MARFSVVVFIAALLVIVQSLPAQETCQSLGGECSIKLWSAKTCDGEFRFPMAGCGGQTACCIKKKQATLKTCAASCGNCLTTKTTPFCAGYKVTTSDCNGLTEFCCVRAWIGPSTCQDMGGTCKAPVPSGIRCEGLLKNDTPGCTANEFCCTPDERSTPEPKTTTIKTEKTCASACGKCIGIKYGCQGYPVPDVTDCNGSTERCCVPYWSGPCHGK